ncbi:Retrovirus-related Pol polyprotein from type-1 retrotransposable element R1 [Eumeta japonica]|uniref:Retrovirus-related Pol polyprotein from type-1 retrotransposable element R1 n=1 Tax=Eumeta variegata TaxID=151549 RepID=A0A4C1W6I5_EUMVA|nr:Retrovirus-related Pol polyprotein from type-1 retrotransposable element R1 [Eumeta japonica]
MPRGRRVDYYVKRCLSERRPPGLVQGRTCRQTRSPLDVLSIPFSPRDEIVLLSNSSPPKPQYRSIVSWTRQYGFMPQRGTEDSLYDLMTHIHNELNERIVVMVSLDIEGLRQRVMAGNKEPTVSLTNVQKGTSKSCIQGSIAGPTFWNLVLDSLLRELGDLGVYVQTFADDVVLTFSGQSASALEVETNRALAHVKDWGDRNKLRFAPSKTNAMVLTKKLKFDVPVTWQWPGGRGSALERSPSFHADPRGLLSLDIQVREAAKLYEVKRGKNWGHLCRPGLERSVDFRELPHPAHTPEFGFKNVEDLDPSLMDRLAIVGPHIYTDGSKIEGKLGAALTEWRDGVESRNFAYRLESFCTVFQAEMIALHRAIRRVKKGKKVRLFWVHAHAGTAGNECADELSRNAALKTKTAADYDRLPLLYAKKTIRAASLDEWQQ